MKKFVEFVFSNCGVNLDQPTKQGILTPMAEGKANAERMMDREELSLYSIIEHHYDEMMKLVRKLLD